MSTWINDNLNTKRNKVMAGRVIQHLRKGSGFSHFFALGLGHFVGNQTIIDNVRKAGFVVERVSASDDLVNWKVHSSAAGNTAWNLLMILSFVMVLANQFKSI